MKEAAGLLLQNSEGNILASTSRRPISPRSVLPALHRCLVLFPITASLGKLGNELPLIFSGFPWESVPQ